MSENNQSQNQKEMTANDHLWKMFLVEAFLFSLTIALGILSALKLSNA
jgi:hypothetical protein